LGRQNDPLFADCDPKFPRESDQNQSFYDPVTPYGEPRLPNLESTPELTVDRFRQRTSLLGEVDRQLAGLERSREFATIYHLLGVDSQMMLPDLSGRPIHIAHGGTPVMEIFA
jgi:hypothetical protein